MGRSGGEGGEGEEIGGGKRREWTDRQRAPLNHRYAMDVTYCHV